MKGFYGWRMVVAGSGLQFLQAGLMMQAFGAYVAVLTEERGWSKTALAGAAALQSIETAFFGPILGWLVDRLGEHRLIRCGIVIFGLGLITLGFVDTLAGFYGAVMMIALGSSFAGYFTLNIAIIHWFERQRARALSAVGLGLALGGVFVPVVAASMAAFGWRATAIGSGVLAIVVGLPLALVFRGRPHALGQAIDGAALPMPRRAGTSTAVTEAAVLEAAPGPTAVAAAAAATTATADTDVAPHDAASAGLTARQALRTSAFWLLSIGHGIALLVVTAVNVHAITHIREHLGYSVSQASLAITLMTIAQICGVLLGMSIGDRFDKRWLCAASMFGHGLGMLMLTWATGPLMLAAFALMHGSAWGLRGPLMQAIRADYFGRRSIGMIMGLSATIIAVGQVGGPLIAGSLADLSGNYRFGFTTLALLALAGSLAFLLARPPALPGQAR
ncbi:MAG TPA: MFS transporter [Burkholderiaceae bacterium]|nr:MFS transporter [Burkholderiaceae bacterium]